MTTSTNGADQSVIKTAGLPRPLSDLVDLPRHGDRQLHHQTRRRLRRGDRPAGEVPVLIALVNVAAELGRKHFPNDPVFAGKPMDREELQPCI